MIMLVITVHINTLLFIGAILVILQFVSYIINDFYSWDDIRIDMHCEFYQKIVKILWFFYACYLFGRLIAYILTILQNYNIQFE